jgi:hypothetical protein
MLAYQDFGVNEIVLRMTALVLGSVGGGGHDGGVVGGRLCVCPFGRAGGADGVADVCARQRRLAQLVTALRVWNRLTGRLTSLLATP